MKKCSKRKLLAPLLSLMLLSPEVLLANETGKRGRRGNRGNGDQVTQPRGDRDNQGQGRGQGQGGRRGGQDPVINVGNTTRASVDNVVYPVVFVDLKAPSNWDRNFIGERNFSLKDDRRLADLIREKRSVENELDSIVKQVKQRHGVVTGLASEVNTLIGEINTLNAAITSSINEKSAAQTKITELEGSLAGLQTEIDLAQAGVDGINGEITKATNQRDKVQGKIDECNQTLATDPENKCKNKLAKQQERVAGFNTTITEKQGLLNAANGKLEEAKGKLTSANSEIETLAAKIASIDSENATRATNVNAKIAAKDAKQAELDQKKANLVPLITSMNQLSREAEKVRTRALAYRNGLMDRVLEVNSIGARNGLIDGENDGAILAKGLGTNFGQIDGDRDGEIDGTDAGQTRDYNIGYGEGQAAGADRAETEGLADGQRTGTIQGNIDAAKREGAIAGIERAQASDASQVGQQQGQTAGLDRAVRTGDTNGTRIGENEGIAKYENATLKDENVSGSFGGAFARQTPGFPSGHRGQAYTPNGKFRRNIVNAAYTTGYQFRYRRAQRRVFNDLIADIYNSIYSDSYSAAYETFMAQAYPTYRQSGFNNGEINAFNRDYPGIRDAYYAQFRAQFDASPNRDAEEYKSTWTEVEGDTYRRVYEEIRLANYVETEQNTFDANIAEQTEIYRKKRFDEVESIYKNNAVLAFVNENIVDGGINEVAKNDGVYMPNETIYHTITVRNYGLKPATNAKVKLASGESFNLPSIPAASTVTVKGAAKSKVNSSRGRRHDNTLVVYSDLAAEARIQGRHFYNVSNSQVNSGSRTAVVADYPISLSGLGTNSTIIINEKQPLNLQVSSKATRAYEGPIKIELTVDASSSVVSKGFNELSRLGRSVSLNDAQVLVSDERDVYSPLTFNAVIKKNGVLLGTLDRAFQTVVKAPYAEKAGKPAIIVNSDQSRTDLLDLVASWGGLQNVSVLDTTLGGRNNAILTKGFEGKTILALERGALSSVDRTLAKSKNSVVIMVDNQNRGLEAIKGTSTFNNNVSSVMNFQGAGNIALAFTNPVANKSLPGHLVAIQSNLRNHKSLLALADLMKVGAEEYVDRLLSEISKNDYINPNASDKLLMQVFNFHVMKEVGIITKAYVDSDGSGFSRGDKDIAELVKSDKSLFHNVMAKKLDSRTKNDNVGAQLVGWDTYKMLDDLDSTKDYDNFTTQAVDNRLFGWGWKKGALSSFRKDVEKNIKKYDKDLRGDMNRQSHSKFAPFTAGQFNNNTGFQGNDR